MSYTPKVGRKAFTRDGRVAFVCSTFKSVWDGTTLYCGTIVGTQLSIAWDENGKCYACTTEKPEDLVAPYRPKRRVPKVGERIKFFHHAIIDEQGIGTVRKVEDEGKCICVNVDAWIKENPTGYVYIDPRQIVRFLNKEGVE